LNSFVSDGIRIAYYTKGKVGDPVVLIHGFTVDTRWNWESMGLIDLLSENFQVIGMDVRGHGESGAPHDRSLYGLELLRDVTRLLDRLDIGKAHFLGYSMGGEIALAYLAYHPDRVLKTVIGGAGLVEEGDAKYNLWKTDGDRLGSAKRGDLVTDIRFPGVKFDELVARTMNANDPYALSAAAYGMLDLALDASLLSENAIPTLLLVGEHDEFKYCADRALQVGRSMEMRVLEDQSHITAISDPDFGKIVEKFLLGLG
jgi:pimeloyl-ACP methyl ester carboxylesterase